MTWTKRTPVTMSWSKRTISSPNWAPSDSAGALGTSPLCLAPLGGRIGIEADYDWAGQGIVSTTWTKRVVNTTTWS